MAKNKPLKPNIAKVDPPRPIALVVDDDDEFLRFLNVILDRLGIRMIAAKTAEEFIQKIKTTNPGICLIDLNLNGLTAGFALVQSIRSKFGNQLPLFVVSGKSDQTAIAHALERGATDFIIKPIDREVLGNKIAKYIASPEITHKEFDFVRAPIKGVPTEAVVEMSVTSIDELGIKLSSTHLLAKGTIVYLHGAVLDEIFLTKTRLIFTIISTWVQPDNRSYGAYAEFNSENEEALSRVREWIVTQKK